MPATEKIRVLIVDDFPDTRENLTKLLGFEPDLEVIGAAESGQQAIALAKKEHPNAILMDINMPDMDGITATEIISNTVPDSPIIMMSVQGEQ
ncbi:MAG: response regulator transcription factor, partial [Chloroflexi bacterium]|nr:response regulator transcription factor [Chloroflexota bacterium]